MGRPITQDSHKKRKQYRTPAAKPPPLLTPDEEEAIYSSRLLTSTLKKLTIKKSNALQLIATINRPLLLSSPLLPNGLPPWPSL
jgi:hypothetical protein